MHPGSHCPKCDRPLSAFENVPLLSFLILRAQCRTCKTPISWRYFWVELITALTFLSVYLKFGPSVETFAYCLFLAPLIAAFCTDVDSFLIPDQLHLFALIIGISYDVYAIITRIPGHSLLWGWLPTSLWGGFICAAVFILIQVIGLALFRKEAMGDGDVKLARAIGAMLPLSLALVSFFLAIAVGAVWGIVSMGAKLRRETAEESQEHTEESGQEPQGGSLLLAILQWSAIYLFFMDALLFLARALRIRKLTPLANEVVPVDSIEEDDFHPGITHVPFGPFMVIGVVLAIFGGQPLISWYLAWSGLGRVG